MSRSLFDRIAPVYNLFFGYQVRSFRTILSRAGRHIIIPPNARVLDIGCGTGALAFCLHERGYRVTGVDVSSGMIDRARKKHRNTGVRLVVGNALEGLPFHDKDFDLVMASYVAHGMGPAARQAFYREARRLATKQVIFQDYNERRKLLSDAVEWLEGGNYFHFVLHAEEGMRGVFSSVEVRSFASQVAWYICTP